MTLPLWNIFIIKLFTKTYAQIIMCSHFKNVRNILTLTTTILISFHRQTLGEGIYPILDISSFIKAIFSQNTSTSLEATFILSAVLKAELSPTLYYVAGPNESILKTLNESFVLVSKLISEMDASNYVQLQRKIILVIKHQRFHINDEVPWEDGPLSEEASQVLNNSLAALIIDRNLYQNCGLKDHRKQGYSSERFSIISNIQRMTSVPIGFGFGHINLDHCRQITFENYFPAEVAIKTIDFKSEVGFPESYEHFKRKVEFGLNNIPSFYRDDQTLKLEPNVSLRLNLYAHEGTYNEAFRSYQSLLRQFASRWQAENGNGIIVNLINDFEPESMLPVQNTFEDSWNKVLAATIPFLFMRDLEETTFAHNCLNIRLQQVATKFDTILLDFNSWRNIMSQKRGLRNPNTYNENCGKLDLESSNSSTPANVLLLVNLNRCEDNSCESLENVLTTLRDNTQIRGMTVTSVIFSSANLFRESPRNLSKYMENLKNDMPKLGCLMNYGDLSKFNGNSIVECPLSAVEPGTGSVSIWELYYGIGDMFENDFDFYTKSIQSQLYKIYQSIQRLDPKHEVILKLVAKLNRRNSFNDIHLFCDPQVLRLNMILEAVTTWAHIHKLRVIVKPAFESETEVGWWSRMRGGYGYEIVARNYPPNSNFGGEPCLPWVENLNEKIVLDGSGSGIIIDMGLRRNQPLNLDELKMMTTLALHTCSTVEFLPTDKEHSNNFRSDMATLTAMILDSNFFANLQLNNITNRTFFVNINSEYLSSSGEAMHKFLRASRSNGNSTILKIAGVHIFLSNPKQDPNHELNIVEEIRKTTELGAVLPLNCINDDLHVSPETTNRIENASYVTILAGEVLDFRMDEKEYLQSVLDWTLTCKQRIFNRFPNLQRIFARQNLLLRDNEERTPFLEVTRYVRRMFFGNEYGKMYNISTFIYGFDRRENFHFGDTAQPGWWTISNYTDLSDSSVFSERQALYFNEPSWKPYFGKQATPEMVEENIDESTIEETLKWNPVIPSGIIIMLVVVIALLLKICRLSQLRTRDRRRFLTRQELREFHDGTLCANAHIVGHSNEQGILNQKFSQSFEIPKSELKADNRRILGSGNFGIVYEAEVKGSPVAVKIPRDSCTKETFRSMLTEVKILAYLGNHENIVEFVGCSTKEIGNGMIYIVTGLCERGSLLNHLRTEEGNLESDSSTNGSVGLDELMRFSIEIASGMEYIGSKNVVHGDLSTRNVLLDQNLTCKIGDFGLSRKLYEYSKYVKTSQEPLPWRWMAYESLLKMEFTSKSDVWSYGVTLWEIFSLGAIPYPGLSWSTNFVENLKSGWRMDSPEHATQDVYLKMRSCWDLDADARPSFSQLREFFLQGRNQLIYTEL